MLYRYTYLENIHHRNSTAIFCLCCICNWQLAIWLLMQPTKTRNWTEFNLIKLHKFCTFVCEYLFCPFLLFFSLV
jgi:hypothetical protein